MSSGIRSYEFSGVDSGPHLLITGGVHGDEFEPISALMELVKIFAEQNSKVASFKGRITIVPCVNEQAFQLGQRCASDGLDLARTCPGKVDGSITERTAFELSEMIRAADYYIDLHTGGTEFSIYPLAGYMLHQDQAVLEQQRAMATAFGLKVVWGTSPSLQGRTLSIARDAKVPAIYCEYLGAATYCSAGVTAYVDGCLNVMSQLGMLLSDRTIADANFLVEDQRSLSGHLQVCQPSPVNGIFVPSVKLGERVKEGDVFGTVFNHEDSSSHTILAEETGIVLMLRTFPRVHAGQSVGVVLKLD